MRPRKIALTLFVCLALASFATSVAQAAEGDGWTIGTTENQTTAGTLIANGVHERIHCARHGTSSLIISGTVSGSPVQWNIGEIDCLEKAGATNVATIDNTTSKGHSEGVFTWTNVKVEKPAGCQVGGATHEITTSRLTDEVIMDPTAGSTTVFDRFFTDRNAKGEEEAVDIVTFEGAECPLAEAAVPLKGTFCGEFVHTNSMGTGFEPSKTGTLTRIQTLLFGAAQQSTANRIAKPCALTIAGNPAQITGAVDFELESGKPFGAD